MALSYAEYVGNGTTTQFSVPFPYINRSHVTVLRDGTPTTFTWISDSLVGVTPAPATGVIVTVKRASSPSARLVDWVDGSVLTEADLDLADTQAFYLTQEAQDAATNPRAVTVDKLLDATAAFKSLNKATAAEQRTALGVDGLSSDISLKADKTTVDALTTTVSTLSTTVGTKATQASVDTLTTTVAGKANTSALAAKKDFGTTENFRISKTGLGGYPAQISPIVFDKYNGSSFTQMYHMFGNEDFFGFYDTASSQYIMQYDHTSGGNTTFTAFNLYVKRPDDPSKVARYQWDGDIYMPKHADYLSNVYANKKDPSAQYFSGGLAVQRDGDAYAQFKDTAITLDKYPTTQFIKSRNDGLGGNRLILRHIGGDNTTIHDTYFEAGRGASGGTVLTTTNAAGLGFGGSGNFVPGGQLGGGYDTNRLMTFSKGADGYVGDSYTGECLVQNGFGTGPNYSPVRIYFDDNLDMGNRNGLNADPNGNLYFFRTTSAFCIDHVVDSQNVTGTRNTEDVRLWFNGPTSAYNANRNYVGHRSSVLINSSDRAENGASGNIGFGGVNYSGAFFAYAPVVLAAPNVLKLAEVAGAECSVGLQTGAEALLRYGWSCVSYQQQQGIHIDAAYVVGAAGGGQAAWRTGLHFNNMHGGAQPISSDGQLIQVADPMTIAWGLDLNQMYTTQGILRTGDGVVFTKANLALSNDQYGNTVLELGNSSGNSASFIDFHTNAHGPDFDARLSSVFGNANGTNGTALLRAECGAFEANTVRPMSGDNVGSVGTSDKRYNVVYATTGAIQTSDATFKKNLGSPDDAVLDAIGEVDLVQFKMLASIEEKGEEAARIHSGIIAQDLKAKFAAHGLDAGRYGL